jgi:hypothetical protein
VAVLEINVKWLHRYYIGLAFILISIVLGGFSLWFYISDLDFRSRGFLMLSGAALSIGITLTIVDCVIKADRVQQWRKVKNLTYFAIMRHLIALAVLLPACFGSDRKWTFEYEAAIGRAIDKGLTTSRKEVSDVMLKMAKAMKNEVEPRDVEEGWGEVFLSKWQKPLEKSTIEELERHCSYMKRCIQEMRNILIPRVLRLSDDQEVNEVLLRFEMVASNFESQLMMIELQKIMTLVEAEKIINLLEESGNLYEILARREATNSQQR